MPASGEADMTVLYGEFAVQEKKYDFTPTATKKPRRILTREDWIDAATAMLVDKSVDSVHPATLAKELGITIGSFYYHFKDRNDLLVSLLKKWHERSTAQAMSSYGSLSVDDALPQLLALPSHGSTARRAAMVEFAIRGWARRDDMAREAVRQVDEQRLAMFAAAFRKKGFTKADAAHRAFMVYGFLLAEATLWDVSDDGARKRRLKWAKKLILLPID